MNTQEAVVACFGFVCFTISIALLFWTLSLPQNPPSRSVPPPRLPTRKRKRRDFPDFSYRFRPIIEWKTEWTEKEIPASPPPTKEEKKTEEKWEN